MKTGITKMKTLIGLSLLTAVLCGCVPEEKKVSDQCLRKELFQQCMAGLPKGPDHVVAAENDWQEVIEECGSQARYMSYRRREFVKPECMAD